MATENLIKWQFFSLVGICNVKEFVSFRVMANLVRMVWLQVTDQSRLEIIAVMSILRITISQSYKNVSKIHWVTSALRTEVL